MKITDVSVAVLEVPVDRPYTAGGRAVDAHYHVLARIATSDGVQGTGYITQGETSMARIRRVGHVVLGVRDPQRSIKFYTEALGMELVKFLDEMQMAFFSFGERDHDIAIIKVPDDQPVGSAGLAHTALEIEGGLEQLRALADRLQRHGATVEFTADHVLTKSVYFFDPDGNRLEIFSQEMPSSEAKRYLHAARDSADVLRPLDLGAPAGS